MNYCKLVPHLAESLENDLVLSHEVETARKRLPLPDLMKILGDGQHLLEGDKTSPFAPDTVAGFKVRQDSKKWCFLYYDKTGCGKKGDEVDYLRLRFAIKHEQAAGVFCALSKLVHMLP